MNTIRKVALAALVATTASMASVMDSATVHLSSVSADTSVVLGTLVGIAAVITGGIIFIRLLRRGTP